MRTDIARYYSELADVLRAMPVGLLARAADLLLDCRDRGATIFIFGNGGSAATASHIACDLAKGTRTDGVAPFRVVALTDNVPLMTAWGNDTAYERIFAEQLSPLIRTGDVVVAVSASGNSPNVVTAVELARLAGAITIALTGQTGGRLRRIADHTIRVPASSIEQVEDAHLAIGHSLCVALRQHMRQPRTTRARKTPRLVDDPAAMPAIADLIAVEPEFTDDAATS